MAGWYALPHCYWLAPCCPGPTLPPLTNRRKLPAPRDADAKFTTLPAPTGCFAFERATADEKHRVLVVTNLSEQPQFQRPDWLNKTV